MTATKAEISTLLDDIHAVRVAGRTACHPTMKQWNHWHAVLCRATGEGDDECGRQALIARNEIGAVQGGWPPCDSPTISAR